jgi:hypothetical protein
VDQLLGVEKIPARPRSCRGRLTIDLSTHQRRERPQPALFEYIEEDGLNISKMLTPSRAPFYGIVPGNAATPLDLVVLPVTFGMKDNYRTEYIKFEVADFESSYHAILSRLALAKLMAVP